MATVLPKILRDFRARELSKFIPSAAHQVKTAGAALTIPSTKGSTRLSNPFLPWYNPKTARWAPPLYSRRRQKELVKAARSVEVDFGGTGVKGAVGAGGFAPSRCEMYREGGGGREAILERGRLAKRSPIGCRKFR